MTNLTPEQVADGWIASAESIEDMVGRPVIYQNTDAAPVVRLFAWLDSIDEGWGVVEFSDNSRATVRPSRIIAYKPEKSQ